MELDEAIIGRRSVRAYSDKPVEEQLLREIINLAVRAPSGSNYQPWAFAVVENKEFMQRWSDLAKRYLLERVGKLEIATRYRSLLEKPDYNIFYNAPALVAIYGDLASPHYVQDCSMAALSLMLAAKARGLGSCWIGLATDTGNLPQICNTIGIAERFKAVAPIILGYPRSSQKPRERKNPLITSWVK